MSYKVAPLTVNPKQKSSFLSKAFVSQPSAEEELLVGRLFVLMEIDQSRADDFALADFIVKEIYRHYYENEQFFLRDKIANLKIDYIFEAALTKLNKGIAEFLEAQKMAFRPGGFSMVIGVLHKNRLLFTQSGQNKAFLLYRPKPASGDMLADYNLLDISEKTDDPTQELTNPNKLFTNVINGAIPQSGYFLFCNEAVLEYLSKKQLTDIITTLPPISAVEQIKYLLEQTNAFVPFFALIIKNTSGEDRLAENPAFSLPLSETSATMGGGRVSVDQFNTTQERTEELLSPSGMMTVKKWLAKLQPASSTLKTFAQDKAKQINLSAGRLKVKKEKMAVGKKFLDVFRVLALLIVDGVKTIYRLITDPTARQSIVSDTKNLAAKAVSTLRDWLNSFRRLTPKHKILLSLITVCLLLFIGNLIYSTVTARQKAEIAKVAEAKVTFEQKENQLEASLLYNNTEGARQILKELEDIIASVPQKTEEAKTTVAELTKRYQTQLDKLFSVTRLEKPNIFVELPASGDNLILGETDLFSANGASKTVYRISPDKTITPIVNDAFSGESLLAMTDEPDIYFWDQRNLFTFQSSDQSAKQMTIENKPTTMSALTVYNTRLYLVSSPESAIYRYNQDKRTFTFSGRQNWLKENVSLNNVKSLTINGRVFMIADNQLLRLNSGTRDTLPLEEAMPKLEEPTQVVSSADQKFLYILEPKHNRIIVYTSEGKYKTQYTSDSFGNLRSLAVTEDNKKMFVLNDKQIYEIPLTK